MLDRLMLDDERVEAMARGIEVVAGLDDPLGKVLAGWDRPNGLMIQRISVPLGVIGIIYESRPNVTADAAALCLKSGNAAILRGGSESFHSSQAIYQCLREGLIAAGVDADAVQMVPTTDRAAVGFLLASMGDWIDVVVPRGGKSLIKRVQDEARVPVIGHLEGICHVYLHEQADDEPHGHQDQGQQQREKEHRAQPDGQPLAQQHAPIDAPRPPQLAIEHKEQDRQHHQKGAKHQKKLHKARDVK